jgi:dipeptidyl aminopeptidase/acylaminoacyl peptidase
MPADLYYSSVDDFEPKRLVELNAQLKSKSLGQASIFNWTSRDGSPVEGLLVKPANFEEGSPVPMITYLHGGPATGFVAAFAPEVWMTAPQVGFCPIQVMTGRGYAVFCPNFRGSDGYGRAFREANMAAWGEDDLEDVLSGIDELVRLRIANPDQLTVTGYCYGGFLSLRALTQTNRFRTAILGAYFGDLTAVYGQTDIPDLFSAYFGGTPWEKRAAYQRCSPMFDAHKVRTPVLLLHAKNDQRIPWTQSKQLHTILTTAGGTAELISYPRGKHTVFEPRMHAETMRQTVTWHQRWRNSPASE